MSAAFRLAPTATQDLEDIWWYMVRRFSKSGGPCRAGDRRHLRSACPISGDRNQATSRDETRGPILDRHQISKLHNRLQPGSYSDPNRIRRPCEAQSQENVRTPKVLIAHFRFFPFFLAPAIMAIFKAPPNKSRNASGCTLDNRTKTHGAF